MNILLFSRIAARSGVGNHMKQLAEELVRRGHHVVVVSSTNDLEIGKGNEIVFERLSPIDPNPVHILKGCRRLEEIITKHQIDLVHCHHRMAAMYMMFYRRFHRIPMVYTLHLANIPSDFLHRKMTYAGDRAIGVSTEVSTYLVEKLQVPKEKVCTVFNGVDEKRLLPLCSGEKEQLYRKWGIRPEGRTVFVMHSRIDEIKNQLVTVRAAAVMPEEYRKRFLFVCSGKKTGSYYEAVIREIKASHLEENFVFTGWAETREILGIADVLVLSSFNEGFPLSVVEAFLMRVPVLRSRTSGFEDQKYCTEMSIDTPEDVAKVLADYLDRPSVYRARIEEAYQYAMENFTLERMTDHTLEVYDSVLEKYRPGQK
ncbi:MAG: glycosyltransferase family 4 protein [Blautia sp.]|nr:glycosyltransferase family 4 protein [Blautia sp.]